jgi:hypothetical protein
MGKDTGKIDPHPSPLPSQGEGEEREGGDAVARIPAFSLRGEA